MTLATTGAEADSRAAGAPGNSPLAWRLKRLAAGLVGFSVFFNVYLRPGSGVRVGDAMAFLLWGGVAFWLLTGRRLDVRVVVRLALALACLLVWELRDLTRTGGMTDTFPVRWIMAVPVAYLLWRLASLASTRHPLLLGLFWGAVANLLVVAVQKAGYTPLTIQLGLASAETASWWARVGSQITVRPAGMWGHPNASSGIIAMAVPVVLGLVDERRLRTPWLLAGLLVAALGSALTLTRSGAVIALPLLAFWAVGSGQSRRQRWTRIGLMSGLAVVALIIGPPGGWERWTDPETGSNVSGRMEAVRASLYLMTEHPMGLGREYQEALAQRTGGVEATHNAWLYLGLTGGVPLALLVLAAVAAHAFGLLRRRTTEGWLALAFLGLTMFEEYFRATAFQILSLWLLASPVRPDRSPTGDPTE